MKHEDKIQLLGFSQLFKHAADRWDSPPEVIMPKRRNKSHDPTFAETILSRKPGRSSDPKMEKKVMKLMASARPEHLAGIRVYSGSMDPSVMFHQIKDNPRTSWLGKGLGYLTRWPILLQEPGDIRDVGPFYDPLTDSVYAPWDAPSATMHELGHAIDFNRGGIPEDWVDRQLKGLTRDAYTWAPLTSLWQEHMAWNSGRKALEEGAIKGNKDWKEIEPIIENDTYARYPALGSYWGGALGLLAGAVGAAASLKYGDRHDLRVPIASVLGGMMVGPLAGLGVGMIVRNVLRKKLLEKAKRKYEKKLNSARGSKGNPSPRGREKKRPVVIGKPVPV